MPRYDFLCPGCNKVKEVIRPMNEAGEECLCDCGIQMRRVFGFRIGGSRDYSRPIVSDSLAVSIDQIGEHRRKFPHIPITSEGQPVFDNYADHQKYLDDCNVIKHPGKKRKRGKEYKRVLT